MYTWPWKHHASLGRKGTRNYLETSSNKLLQQIYLWKKWNMRVYIQVPGSLRLCITTLFGSHSWGTKTNNCTFVAIIHASREERNREGRKELRYRTRTEHRATWRGYKTTVIELKRVLVSLTSKTWPFSVCVLHVLLSFPHNILKAGREVFIKLMKF